MMILSEAEIRAQLQKDEGQYHDFKSLWDLDGGKRKPLDRRKVRDWIAEYAAAFANADGGLLFLGVDDDGTPSGHGYPEDVVAEFLTVPERRLRPPVRVRTQRERIDGQEIILIEVPMHPEAVMVDGNGFPYRVGDKVIREPQEAINARKQAYRRVGFEQQARPEATLDALDLTLASSFMSKGLLQNRPVLEQLKGYGLVVEKPGGLVITNAALLLFGKPPFARWHPRAGIRFLRVSGAERLHGAKRNVVQTGRVEPPIAKMIDEAYKSISLQVRNSEKLHDLFFKEMPEYPTFAWQEALVNAVAHRDYNDQGREIEISFYDDRMEIQSPGTLVPPVTLDALRKRRQIHASRNPLMTRVLVDAAIMREEGEGIPRIFEEMKASSLRAPEFSEDDAAFTVLLRNEPVFEGATLEWKAVVDGMNLSTSQKRALMAYPDGFTNEDYRQLNSLDRDQGYREIMQMVEAGTLQPTTVGGRGAFYPISPRVRKTKDWLSKRLPKLDSFFKNHDRMKNADYRSLFQATRNTAQKELLRLVDAGVLDRQGEKRGAVYRPGEVLSRRKGAGA